MRFSSDRLEAAEDEDHAERQNRELEDAVAEPQGLGQALIRRIHRIAKIGLRSRAGDHRELRGLLATRRFVDRRRLPRGPARTNRMEFVHSLRFSRSAFDVLRLGLGNAVWTGFRLKIDEMERGLGHICDKGR